MATPIEKALAIQLGRFENVFMLNYAVYSEQQRKAEGAKLERVLKLYLKEQRKRGPGSTREDSEPKIIIDPRGVKISARDVAAKPPRLNKKVDRGH